MYNAIDVYREGYKAIIKPRGNSIGLVRVRTSGHSEYRESFADNSTATTVGLTMRRDGDIDALSALQIGSIHKQTR